MTATPRQTARLLQLARAADLAVVPPAAVSPAGPQPGRAMRSDPALQLATVAEVGARIAACRTIEAVLRAVTAEARWIVSFARCTLALASTDGLSYQSYTLDGGGRGAVGTAVYPLADGLAGWVLRHNQALRIDDLGDRRECGPPEEALLAPNARSVMILPLLAEGLPIGTVNFSAVRPRAYPPETLAVAQLLALQIGGAVSQALLLEDLDGSENVILSLAHAIEAKDPNTEGHCQRLAAYAERLGRALGFGPVHLRTLRMAATLHDIGKIAVPEAILGKPGPLTSAEFATLQGHPIAGAEICAPLRSARAILPAIRHHHERWDGQGYPDGLRGPAIPLDARIIAIVDAFDAMTSDRPYRRGMPIPEAVAIMRANTGPQWDPGLLKLFLELIEAEQATGQPT